MYVPPFVKLLWNIPFDIATRNSSPQNTIGLFPTGTGTSQGGHAECNVGFAFVPIEATATNLLLDEPANQTVSTELFQELFQKSSTLASRTYGGSRVLRENYKIELSLCVPKNTKTGSGVTQDSASTVQILTHGIGLDRTYWDIAPGYSYVDAAAEAGYATLAYNRLGVGASSHPDPIQVVQAPVEVEILHGLIKLLKEGRISFGGQIFSKVIGVGHSYGSFMTLGMTAKYPQDVDAVVLTGFTTNPKYLATSILAGSPAIADQNWQQKFKGLPNGYVTYDSKKAFQSAFYRFPFYPEKTFEQQFHSRDTFTIAQQLTLSKISQQASSYAGPVDIVNGVDDFVFCGADCNYPSDQSVLTKNETYPNAAASSQTALFPNIGHNIHSHYDAHKVFKQINSFLQGNGL